MWCQVAVLHRITREKEREGEGEGEIKREKEKEWLRLRVERIQGVVVGVSGELEVLRCREMKRATVRSKTVTWVRD